ncbi:MAG: AI-2E family transporter, partial [Porphyromonadaceae bacterium]|nr:AI-2E family transporter [Porphyromonadaceae bacterium]
MLVLSVLILLIYVAVQAIWSVILPFLLAGIFAYVMMPLVRFFQYTLRLRSRGLSVILTLLLLGAVVYLAIIFIIPSINAEIEKTLQVISGYSSGQDILTMILPRNIRNYLNGGLRWGNFPQQLSFEKVLENVKLLLDQVGGIINSTLSIFSWGLVFLIGFIYFVFILLDFENLARGFISLFPKTLRPTIRTISMDLDRYMNNYFRGQALIAISVGILLSIGFNIIGLPLATAMGIFIGILNFIPYM